MTELTLSEELLLLVLHDERGTKITEYTSFATAAAALAEMVLAGQLVPSPDDPDRYVWGDPTPADDAFLQGVRAVIEKKGVSRKVKDLIMAIGNKRGVFQPLYDRMVERGILHREEKSFLFFKWQTYPERDPSPERALKSRLEQVMFHEAEPTANDAILIAICDKIHALRKNFDKDQLKQHKKRIQAISKGEGIVGQAVKDAIAAMQAVIIAAAIVPAVATTTG